jgi:hypothetical protein
VTIERPSGTRPWLRSTHSPAETIVRGLAIIRETDISDDEIQIEKNSDTKNKNVVLATAPRRNTGFIPGVSTDTDPSQNAEFIPIRYNNIDQIPEAIGVASKVFNPNNTTKHPMAMRVNGGGTPKSHKKKPKKSLKKKPKKSLKKKPKKLSKKKSTKKSTSKSTPKKHKGPRGGVYIIRKGRKIYQ